MSEEKTQFSPAAAAEWLGVDVIEFTLEWLPGYKKHLSEGATNKDYPILSTIDLALLEQVKTFRASGHSHKVIKRTLTEFYRPATQARLRVVIEAAEKRRRATTNRIEKPPLIETDRP